MGETVATVASNSGGYCIQILNGEKAMNKAKMKQVGFIALVAVGATLALNTVAKRFAPAAKIKQTVDNGL